MLADVAHSLDFKVLITARGGEALDLVTRYDVCAISLDIFLPDTIGWNVLSNLKHNPATRHIPVQIVTSDDDRQHGLARGAFSFLTKTANGDDLKSAFSRIRAYTTRPTRRLLVAEDNAAEQLSIRTLLAHDDLEIVTASTGAQCRELLRSEPFDCAVFDLRLPDISGFELLKEVGADPALADLPVVVFTGRELSADEDAQLHTMARSIVVKGVESPERLLDETALFLHRALAKLPADKQRMLERLRDSDEKLVGRTVLLVDDDARNVFALSSVLERRGMKVLTATTGNEAIQLIEFEPAPVDRLDGYHDAGHGRLSGHRRNSRKPCLAPPTDYRADRKGDERRPRKMPGSRRFRLPRQTRQYRATAVHAAQLAAPVSRA